MSRGVAYRGQPALVLLALLAGWVALRIVFWQTPFPSPGDEAAPPMRLKNLATPARDDRPADREAPIPSRNPAAAPPAQAPREPWWRVPQDGDAPADDAVPAVAPPEWSRAEEPRASAFEPVAPRIAGGQALLLAAGLSTLEVPAELAALMTRGRATPAAVPAFSPVSAVERERPGLARWSGDGWLLLRRDTTTPVTSGRGSYGRSQVGAVLRYRLAPSSGHRPTAYLRASAALAGPREAEAALGLAGRPLPAVPVAVAVEARAARYGQGEEVRPAAFAYSEFPPLKLPLGVRGEAYFQAGYVGGRYATPFVDGQLRLDHEVARLGPAELRAGGGAWGGAQDHARRLDVGPGATVSVEVGGAPLRMSADWRFRVAGEANPASGPALTVSTGF